jgi:hypothetical protein
MKRSANFVSNHLKNSGDVTLSKSTDINFDKNNWFCSKKFNDGLPVIFINI